MGNVGFIKNVLTNQKGRRPIMVDRGVKRCAVALVVNIPVLFGIPFKGKAPHNVGTWQSYLVSIVNRAIISSL